VRLWHIGVLALGVAVVAAGVVLLIDGDSSDSGAPSARKCDGSVELCDRPLTDVTLPATHNSMSAPLPGWRSVSQSGPISEQLSDGIRGLLIDTHYGRVSGDRVRTDFRGAADMRLQEQRDDLSPVASAIARGIRAQLKPSAGSERRVYLCHTFCELGATPLDSVLDDIEDFLARHRDEVLIVINEDYVDPADYVAAIRRAGLERLAFDVPEDGSWPTVRQMIEKDQRVVFLAENRAGAAPWYRRAFENTVQDTPYSFSRPSQLTSPERLDATCRRNRGPDDAPLLLINHWITSDPWPLRSNADRVNAYEPLLRRARECAQLRGLMPTMLAVDFHQSGDLFRVANTLNRMR
jgi:hypothetical protein